MIGTSDQFTVYDYINRAVRILRNKACDTNITWDVDLIYCNIETDPSRYIVALPYQLEKPLLVNINSTPAFSRGQLFEFSMNGPGSTDPLVGFQWMDMGNKPLQSPLPFQGLAPFSPGNIITFQSDNPLDASIYGNPVGHTTQSVQLPDVGGTVTVPTSVPSPFIVGQNYVFSGGFTFTVFAVNVTNPLLNVTFTYNGGGPSLPTNTMMQGTGIYPVAGTTQLQCLVQRLDGSEASISYILGLPGPPVADLLAVNKPITTGNISLLVNGMRFAVYAPSDTNPRFSQIKISQPGSSVRILGRRRYFKVSNTTDFIPLQSTEALIQMVKAVKFYDEDQIQYAQQCEQTAMMWLKEDNASRMLYAAMAQASQQPPILNINIYNRDSLIVGDIFEYASAAFGQIGQQNLFDQITIVIETLQNMSQWDPAIGYVDIQSFGGPDGSQFYLTLPRYVEEVLAINVNGHPAQFNNKWFEFHLNGLGQDNSDGKFPFQAGAAMTGLSTNRNSRRYEDVGEFVTAFDPLPINTPFQLIGISRNNQDINSSFRVYGYDANNLPIFDSDGSEGFLVPVRPSSSVSPPNPAGSGMVRCERIFRDPTTGFIDLWTCDSAGNLVQFLSTYWPDETEPKYRRIKLGVRPRTDSATGAIRYPVVRMRYRKRWRKITALTDPIHLRSRKAIMTAIDATTARGITPDAERAGLMQAVQYLNDEWRSTHSREGLDIQVDSEIWPAVTYENMT